MPHLEALHKKYSKKGLVIISISLTRDEKSVRRIVERTKLTYKTVLDRDLRTAKRYSIGPTPTGYIIDTMGVIKHKHIGFSRGLQSKFEEEIKALLPGE